MPWRSPADQPGWARPALLMVTAVALVVHAWDVHRVQLHLYYETAVKSMSQDWTAFLYGTVDPAATLTMDKLPGVFWVQALSARLFGFSSWSVLLPQLIAGAVTILVLYRVVRRWTGPTAGLIAAAVYASTPIVAALARTQIPDVMLVMLTVLAADAWQRAVATGRLRSLLLCGVWVGLAFQAKMAHAWAAWVPFALAYLAFAAVPVWRRIAHLAAAGAVTLVLSSVWVVVMLAIPASRRPYIDGSMDNSPLSMVFGYNAFNRYGVPNSGAEELGVGGPLGKGHGSPWLYMFGDNVAPQVGWLYPVVLLGLVAALVAARRGGQDADRADQTRLVRAGYAMWVLWLLTQVTAFVASVKPHTFYLLCVAPAIAALAGAGVVALWTAYRQGGWRQWLLPVTVALSVAWVVYLSGHFFGFYPWLAPAVVATGAVATAVLVLAGLARRDGASGWRRAGAARTAAAGVTLGLATVLLAPAAWALSVTDNLSRVDAHRPAAGPASREVATVLSGRMPRVLPDDEVAWLQHFLDTHPTPEKYDIAIPWAPQSNPFVLAGRTVLPVGGFTAQVPNVTPSRFAGLVERGELRYALVDGPGAKGMVTTDYPGYAAWVRLSCVPVPGYSGSLYTLYDCRPGTSI
ncbi:MAG TPA: glycosyltransferase family 39 protein [Micromonosporaceae bacterium]|nr:glycosyltransferase family 39 protein [Micromonosporaceae bacterium]